MKNISFIITVMMTFLALNISNAQSSQKERKQNPFSLVYEGAISENEKG